MTLLYGFAAVFLVWWVLKTLQRANPRFIVKVVRYAGGGILGALAGYLLVRGRIDMALLLGGIAAGLLGWNGLPLPQWRFPGQEGQAGSNGGFEKVSRVRSKTIEMELQRDTGDLNGRVISGSRAGQALNTLSEADLTALRESCIHNDPEGARLLEVYLDRRFPGWREHADFDMNTGLGAHFQPGAMSEQEAYEILGLKSGASEAEIRRAHRTLIKRLHPDQGGSTYLAVRVNQAKDTLLSRHR